jgi:hypothetical protein
MTKTRLLQAAGLLVLGGACAAVALITLAIRSHQAGSAAQPAVMAPAGAAKGVAQQGQGTTTAPLGTAAPVRRVIVAGPLAPGQAPILVPVGQAGGAGTVLPDPHGPASTKPIASVAPVFADGVDGGSVGLAPLNRAPAPGPGSGICSPQKNCR